MQSQLDALSEQLPRLYLILAVSSVAVAITHYNLAPMSLTVLAPAILLLICGWRAHAWRRIKGTSLSAEAARARLRQMVALTAILGAIFTGWSLLLSLYGNTNTHSHVIFYMAITTLGCVSCLMTHRAAALTAAAVATVPFSVRFVIGADPVSGAISVNFLLVAILMMLVASTHHRHFKELIDARADVDALSQYNSRLANLDVLTGLPNRRSFLRDVESLIAVAGDDCPSFALGIIALDGFKPVNDLYGYAAGDRVLIEVGRRLQETLGPTALVARLGGDEFAMVLPKALTPEAVRATGQTICAAIMRPFHEQDRTIHVAASVGIVLFPDSGATREELFERADYALIHAKTRQRGTAVLFSSEHDLAIRAKSRVEQELRQADLETEMTLVFQPIFDVDRGRIVSFEALARWHSPALGAVDPDRFIVAAERNGMINRLTEVLFAKALATARDWPEDVGLSFNLSVSDIASPPAMARLRGLILRSGVRPTRIAAEITETALMHDFAQAQETLRALRGLGVCIALDDFGTGFSSLSYIHRLPIDTVKIDRSFIGEIVTNPASRDIVRSITGLCRTLKILCVVEGVETAEQARIVAELGCVRMQGFHFGRPMVATAATEALRRTWTQDQIPVSALRA